MEESQTVYNYKTLEVILGANAKTYQNVPLGEAVAIVFFNRPKQLNSISQKYSNHLTCVYIC
jgi:enoyl-CoA hydratase/carnithine racemase